MICKKNMPTQVFLLVNTETENPYAPTEISEAMLLKKFIPLADGVENVTFNFGFNAWDSVTDNTLAEVHHPEFGQFVVAGYRFDRKRVPSSVVKIAYEKRAKKFLADWNTTHPEQQKKTIEKETKKHILEAAKDELLKTMPFTVKEVGVFYDTTSGFLIVTGASPKEAEHVFFTLSQALHNAPPAAVPLSLTDIALEYVDKFSEIKGEFEKLCAKDSLNFNQAYAEFLSYLWFTSEAVASNKYRTLTAPDGSTYKIWMSGADLIAAVVNSAGKLEDILTSKESDHAHIRYAMWQNNSNVVKCKFDMENSGADDTSITMSATNLTQFTIALSALNEKVPTRDDYEGIVINYCSLLFGTLAKMSALFAEYATVRVSEARWNGTVKAYREWLEAYAPACEVAEAKRLAKAEK